MLGAIQVSFEVYSPPAVEEKDYNVVYSFNGVHLTFKRLTAPTL
jgi:hypothetical protein